jgi:hypothetical protein
MDLVDDGLDRFSISGIWNGFAATDEPAVGNFNYDDVRCRLGASRNHEGLFKGP